MQELGADTGKEVQVPAGVRLQTTEAKEVADRLVELSETGPTGLMDDIGGPEVLSLEDMVKDYLAARESHAAIRSIDPKGSRWLAWTGETHLCPERRYGRVKWREYLRREYGR
jgi:hypothetical protein